MRYQEQYEAFKKLTIQQGICTLEQLNSALPFGHQVPERIFYRWLNRLSQVPTEFSTQRRYVNRFKVGADPEFVFVNPVEDALMQARLLHLAQGLAFGMDNNGRLIEIRPHPSRSVLEVTASILTTLRWLSLLRPECMKYSWICGPFLYGDGLGGHVHFGRKRPNRSVEVKALDAIDDELVALRAYPQREVQLRRAGDAHHNAPYGLPGDVRPQRHGYEYRTFPSWLDSPELAFLTMVLSKLVVHNPLLTQGFTNLTPARRFQRIRNILSYFKDTDDDARLALIIVSRSFPIHIGGDFRARWGLGSVSGTIPTVNYIPSSIPADESDTIDLFQHFLDGKPLTPRIPKPTWSPLVPPAGYKMAIDGVQTWQAKGLGELLAGLVQSTEFKYTFVNTKDLDKDCYFIIPERLAASLPKEWRTLTNHKIQVYGSRRDTHSGIHSSEKARESGAFHEIKAMLTQTVFPFWSIDTVKEDSWSQWMMSCQRPIKPPSKQKYFGHVLFGDLAPFERGL